MRVGFIGLGNIGLPMAKRLVAAGLDTTVYDVVSGACGSRLAGARAAASPREVAAASDVVGLCVRDDADVRAVMLGDAGVLAGAAPGAVVAIHSTVQPATVIEVAALRSRARGRRGRRLHHRRRGRRQRRHAHRDGRWRRRARRSRASLLRVLREEGGAHGSARDRLQDEALQQPDDLSRRGRPPTRRCCSRAPPACRKQTLEEVTGSNGNLTDPMRAFLALHKAPEATRSSEGFQSMMRGFVEIAEKDLAASLALARECGIALPGTAMASQIMARVYGLDDENRR